MRICFAKESRRIALLEPEAKDCTGRETNVTPHLEVSKMKSKALKTAAAMVVLSVFGVGGYVIKLSATPAAGVIRTLIGRGTSNRFMVNTDTNKVPFQYIAKAQPAIDMEVDTHAYTPLGSTGWHKHPGPVYITVTSGELTFYELDDPTCSPHVYKAGQGFC
jgi:hypothetical protein